MWLWFQTLNVEFCFPFIRSIYWVITLWVFFLSCAFLKEAPAAVLPAGMPVSPSVSWTVLPGCWAALWDFHTLRCASDPAQRQCLRSWWWTGDEQWSPLSFLWIKAVLTYELVSHTGGLFYKKGERSTYLPSDAPTPPGQETRSPSPVRWRQKNWLNNHSATDKAVIILKCLSPGGLI